MKNPMLNLLDQSPVQRSPQVQNNGNIFQQFAQFRQQMAGKDPQQILNGMIQSGQITQEQLNQAKSQAESMMPMLRMMMR